MLTEHLPQRRLNPPPPPKPAPAATAPATTPAAPGKSPGLEPPISTGTQGTQGTHEGNPPPHQPSVATPAPVPERPLFLRLLRFGALALAALAVLAAVFYVEENVRGRSAWEAVQIKLESQQEKLDWAGYLPPAVPDDQNFFKAPGMQDWFAGKGTNELTARLALNTFAALVYRMAHSNDAAVVAELIIRPPVPGATPPEAGPPSAGGLPILDNLPLPVVISRLARQAGLNVQIDPQIPANSLVSGVWPNTSALARLMEVLSEYNLRWVDEAKTGQPLIKNAEAGAAAGGADAANRDFVLGMIRGAIGPVGEIADGIILSSNVFPSNQPWQLSIAPDSVPTQKDLDRLFGANVLGTTPRGNSLEVLLFHPPVAAADYLAWSDQFAPEFDKMREAVKRPSARLDGDYEQRRNMPTPDLTAIHMAASRLASRAKALLMLGRPGEALRELTLLHGLRGCLEARPAGKPTALAVAMANVAIAKLYADTAGYGLRLQAWDGPEMAALQEQFSRIDLVSAVWSGLESERAGDCHWLESGSRSEAALAFGVGGVKTNFWQKLASPARMAVKLMPRGWLFQNMAHLADMDQEMIDPIDRLQGLIHPRQVEEARGRIEADLHQHRNSLYWFLAKDMIPPITPSLKATALAQTAVNQALIVCALERCRLERGEYPATLHELVPEFIPLLPPDPVTGEPMKYRPAGPGRFLLYSPGWDGKDTGGDSVDVEGNGYWIWGRL